MKLNGYIGTIKDKEGFLYNNGVTEYKIVRPNNPSLVDNFAVEELTLIFQRAGVWIDNRPEDHPEIKPYGKNIYVGDTEFFKAQNITLTQKEFKHDGFIIKTVGDSIILKGVGGFGTTFACYSLMERLAGYVYLCQDEWKINNVAPIKEFDIKEIPSFYGRNAYSYDTIYDKKNGIRLRVNGEYFNMEGYKEYSTPWSILNDQSYCTQILDYRKYQKDHPDWFYIPEDKIYANPPTCYPQICYTKGLYDDSEGGFFKTFIFNLINDYIIPEKTKSFFMLGISDNMYYCDCPKCQEEVEKYTKSGLAMRFVNKVADAVEKWRKENAPEREIYVVSFAYMTITEPPVIEKDGEYYPVDESVIARDNVIIQYAPIRENYLYNLLDKEHNANSRRAILGWSKVCKKLAVWDYRQDFASHVYPFQSIVTAQDNLEIYKEYGFVDIFHQAQRFCTNSPLIQVDNFARSRMHWDMTEKFSDLYEEGLQLYYKETAPVVKEYIEELKKLYKRMEEKGYDGNCHYAASRKAYVYEKEDFDKLLAILNKGYALAETNKERKVSILKDRLDVLTLYPKFGITLLFTKDYDKDYVLDMLLDIKAICYKSGFTQFCTRQDVGMYIKEAERVAKGELEEEKRVFKKFVD